MTAKEFADTCANFVNSYSTNEKEFAKEMCRQHRTLQQSFTRLIIGFLKEQAKEDDYDLRNQNSIRLSRKVVELLENEKISLPLV